MALKLYCSRLCFKWQFADLKAMLILKCVIDINCKSEFRGHVVLKPTLQHLLSENFSAENRFAQISFQDLQKQDFSFKIKIIITKIYFFSVSQCYLTYKDKNYSLVHANTFFITLISIVDWLDEFKFINLNGYSHRPKYFNLNSVQWRLWINYKLGTKWTISPPPPPNCC